MSSQLQNLPLRVPLCFPNVATENKKSGNWKSFTRGWSVLFLTAVFKASVGFLVDKGKDKAVERPSEGDITEQKFRSAIVREIDDIKSKLDGFSKKDLLANYQLLYMRKESSCWMKYSIKRCRSEGGEVPVRTGCAEVYSRRKEWETWSFLVNKIKKIKFVFTRVTHNSHTTDKPEALEFPIELEFRNVDFCGGRKTGEPGENPRSKDENQQQTQPTYDTGSGNRARATLVGGERDRHCAIPASQDESATRVLANIKERFKDALTTSDRILAMEYWVMSTILETVDNPVDAMAPCRVSIKELYCLSAVMFKTQERHHDNNMTVHLHK